MQGLLLLQAAMLPSEYKEGKLQAFRLLCAMMSRRQDLQPNSDFLVHFYFVMRLGLTSQDQVRAVPLLSHALAAGDAAKTCCRCCGHSSCSGSPCPGEASGIKHSVQGEEKT